MSHDVETDTSSPQIHLEEIFSLYMNYALRGGWGHKRWSSAVHVMASGQIPGETYEQRYLDSAWHQPEVLCEALMVGAIRVAQKHKLFTGESIEAGSVADDVGLAIATAYIWTSRQDDAHYSRFQQRRTQREVMEERMFQAIWAGQKKYPHTSDAAAYQLRLWELLEHGLEQFDDSVFVETGKARVQYARNFLKSLIVADAQAEFFPTNESITSGLVDAALTRDRAQTLIALRLAMEDILRWDQTDPWEPDAHIQKAHTHAWKRRMSAIALDVSRGMDETSAHRDLLIPMLKALDFTQEYVRAPIVGEIISRFSDAPHELKKLVRAYVNFDQRIALLLLRGLPPADYEVQKAIEDIRQMDTRDIHVEIPLLIAWREAHAESEQVREALNEELQSLLDVYAAFDHLPYNDVLRYAPRMMSVDGALAVVAHGLASDDLINNDFAAIGLLNAIVAFKARGELFDAESKIRQCIETYRENIRESRLITLISTLDDASRIV